MVPQRIPYPVTEPRVDRRCEKESDCQSQVGSRGEEQDEHLEGLRRDIAEAVITIPDEAIKH